ncbi:unnamed protein product [Paramecium octaurelia]|uniref:Phospholipid-transporting ATPase n=1 Tax=Paramecium octaurelia TaxID=43137 RepID=A0A8S1UK00_PAROT|nr:unnamed protein product [Paramecium octaurelia]
MNIVEYRKHQNENQIRTCCCKRRAPWELQPDRKILIGTADKNIPNNRVETSKYNMLTFIPKNSLEQFMKASNLYFLLLGVFQIQPSVTTTDGQPTVYLPLSFIIMVSMIKDFFEDFKRHRADDEENNRTVQKYSLRTGVFEYDKWQNVYVGDIIRIANKQRIPADIIILATSKGGECFVETKNLDGETNLKPKYAHPQLQTLYKQLNEKELPYNLFVTMDFERQNPLMYKFKGSFNIVNENKELPKEALNYENFLERGCSLQNTDWILAVTVYTGHDTKIMMNSIIGKMKYSIVEILMSEQILWVLLFLLFECIFASTYYNVWYQRNMNELQSYLNIDKDAPENNSFYNFVLRFAMWFLLLGNSVPISLLVTLETVKFFQAQMIQWDKNYLTLDRPAAVHSSNLSEELGVIEYIFSDKTGTLTQNIMKFKSLIIDEVVYGDIEEQNQNQQDVIDEKPFQEKHRIVSQNVDFTDDALYSELISEFMNKKSARNFTNNDHVFLSLLCLSLCHTIQTELVENIESEIQYNASSPDELALVSFAAEMGFKYIGKEDNVMKVYIKHTKEILKFQIQQVIEFNSTRKRMSIVLKDQNGRLTLFCKGADNIILSMLQDFEENDTIQKNILFEIKKQLQEYATIGLRTLVLGYKELEQKEYEKFLSEYNRAQSILDDDQLRESLMNQLEEMIENNLQLLCATAIEDKLQDKVGEVIADLKSAGINVWVLTGDKIETAINIGFSCKLLTDQVKRFIIDGDQEGQVERQLAKVTNSINEHPDEPLSLIVSGVALVIIIHNFKEAFFKVALKANAVMACRVSPKQKQEIVNLVRRQTGKITLAIGDGANDVAMITQAHVGIGIRGLEGQQAAKASDYAIGEFKHLRRLLFYSGHESYRKNSNLILFNFYKNQLYIGAFFFFGFSNGFSGQNLYDQWLSQIFNVFFTSLPIILYALFDEKYPNSNYMQLVQDKSNFLESRPDIYREYLTKPIFNLVSFWKQFLWGLLQSILLMIISFYAFEPVSPHIHGQNSTYLEAGMTIMSAVVIIVNFKVLLLHNTNYPIIVYINIGSTTCFILLFLLFSQYPFFESFDLFQRLYECFNYYMAMILMLTVTNFFDLGRQRYNYFVDQQREHQLNNPPTQLEIEM